MRVAMVNLCAIISIFGLTAVSAVNLLVLEASAINLLRNNVSLMFFYCSLILCSSCSFNLDHAKEKYKLKASATELWL